MDELKMGIYRHYKGPLYQVLGLAHDANTDVLYWRNNRGVWLDLKEGRTVVVYIALELDGAHPGPRLAVRTLADFLAEVHTDDGTSTADCPLEECLDPGMPRFRYLGPELTADML